MVDYKGLTVLHMTELRKRLIKANAESSRREELGVPHIAAKEAGVGDLNSSLTGQIAGRQRAKGHFDGGKGGQDLYLGFPSG